MKNKHLTVIVLIFVVWVALMLQILSTAIKSDMFFSSDCSYVYAKDIIETNDVDNTSDEFLNYIENSNNEKAVQYSSIDITTLPEIEYSGTKFYRDEDAVTIAKLLYGECRGIPSREEKEAVVWVVLNRVDDNRFPNTVYDVVTAKGQFEGYDINHPVWEELLEISNSVLTEWNKEQNGEISNRSLPSDYFFFHGDGVHNWFRKEFRDKTYYDFGG